MISSKVIRGSSDSTPASLTSHATCDFLRSFRSSFEHCARLPMLGPLQLELSRSTHSCPKNAAVCPSNGCSSALYVLHQGTSMSIARPVRTTPVLNAAGSKMSASCRGRAGGFMMRFVVVGVIVGGVRVVATCSLLAACGISKNTLPYSALNFPPQTTCAGRLNVTSDRLSNVPCVPRSPLFKLVFDRGLRETITCIGSESNVLTAGAQILWHRVSEESSALSDTIHVHFFFSRKKCVHAGRLQIASRT